MEAKKRGQNRSVPGGGGKDPLPYPPGAIAARSTPDPSRGESQGPHGPGFILGSRGAAEGGTERPAGWTRRAIVRLSLSLTSFSANSSIDRTTSSCFSVVECSTCC